MIAPGFVSDRHVWTFALWSGLVMALGESLLYFGWQVLGTAVYISADILWAALIVDVGVCLSAGLLISTVVRRVPWLQPWVPTAFAFLIYGNWTAIVLHDRVHTVVLPIVAAGLAKVTVDLVERREGRARWWVRRSVPWLGAAMLLTAAAVPLGRKSLESRRMAALPDLPAGAPNVLILLLDAFRADHSSAYGYERPTTPHIDELARSGTLFERAFATSSYTLASHASLLTGLLPHEHRAEWVEPMEYRSCDCPTLGEKLQERGYATAGFSANPYWFTREYGFARGFHRFEDFFGNAADAAIRTTFGRAIEQLVLPRVGYLQIPGRKSAEFQNRRLLRWLDDTQSRPFFAFVNYFDVHDPYLPPEPYRHRFSSKPVGGLINWRITGLDPHLTEDEIAGEVDAYDGAITYIDEQIGALLDELDERGILENTVVIVTSDHGEEFGEHGLLLHGHGLHAQSIHVPLIVVGPGVQSDVRVPDPVSNAAIPSTVMHLIQGDAVFPMEPLIGSHGPREDIPMAELVQKPWGSDRFPAYHGAMQAVIKGPWHLIRHDIFGPELYHLDQDPAEQSDLADEPEQAARVRQMDALLDAAWYRQAGPGRAGAAHASHGVAVVTGTSSGQPSG